MFVKPLQLIPLFFLAGLGLAAPALGSTAAAVPASSGLGTVLPAWSVEARNRKKA